MVKGLKGITQVSSSLTNRIRRKLICLRLRPIRVFCLHQISPEYDPIRCCEGDWISEDSFIRTIKVLLKEYTFIPLSAARKKLEKDIIRLRNYAVLTFDDGYRSVLPTLKWLESQGIPYTLFLNGKYLDGQSCSAHVLENARRIDSSITVPELSKGLYLNEKDIKGLSACVGSHGYEHLDATQLAQSEFHSQLKMNIDLLKEFKSFYVPFHAYTWGRHDDKSDSILTELGLIPVLIDGQKNFNDPQIIHRELLPAR